VGLGDSCLRKKDGKLFQRLQMAQSANLLKRTDRLLWCEAETSSKNPNTFIFGLNTHSNLNGVRPLMPCTCLSSS